MSAAAYDAISSAVAAADYARLVRAIPYAAYLGMAIADVDGERRYRLPFRDDLIGNVRRQALHGGAVAGFLESVALLEVLISQEQRRIPKVVDFAVDYLRSGRPQETLAACRVLRQGRSVVQVQAEAWQAQRERPIAFARADFLLADL